MKNIKTNPNEEKAKSPKSKESNPVTMNGDNNMRKPVRGLK